MKDFYHEVRNGIHYFRFRDPVTKEFHTCRSSNLTNYEAALRWATLEYEKIKAKAGSSSSPFGEWADRFFKEDCPHIARVLNEGKTYSDQTRKDNRRYVEEFLLQDPIARIPLNEIKRADIIDLQDRIVQRYGRTRTAQRVYGAFHIILHEAVIRGRIFTDPSSGVKKISYKATPRKALTKKELEKFLDPMYWSNKTHWKMTMTARYTGLRAGEIRALCWEHMDKEENRILVLQNLPGNTKLDDGVKLPKWGKVRTTVYPEALQQILEPDRKKYGLVFHEEDGSAVDYWDWHDSVVNAREASGVKHSGVHVLRHSLDTHLAEDGINQELRRAMFGWTNEQTEANYNHRDVYDIGSVTKKVNRLFKSKVDSGRGKSDSK